MAFNTYAEGLKIASASFIFAYHLDLANRAILVESSLSTLSVSASPLPTLLKAFPLYISSAEAYSHLLSSKLVPAQDVLGIKKKWRLVLERAEKVKKRVEELGGHVGRAGVGDEGEEAAVVRRGGRLHGIETELWRIPSEREFVGETWRGVQPELAEEQIKLRAQWAETPREAWKTQMEKGRRWVVRQGVGADCSVVAGLGVCLEHDRRWGTSLALGGLYPQASTGLPKHSENGKHVVKLLLNGAWRSVVIDALLPRSKETQHPLHPTAHQLGPSPTSPSTPAPESHPQSSQPQSPSLSSNTPSQHAPQALGPPSIPLLLKAYFLSHGGYSLRGSNPSPDVYALTGWIPERISLRECFQREKEWRRISAAWGRGEVLVTLGTGEEGGAGLVPLHAYGVLVDGVLEQATDETDLKEQGGERVLEIFDPGSPAEAARLATLDGGMGALTINGAGPGVGSGNGSSTGLLTMTWDEVCERFASLNLNWNPSLKPVTAIKHWSWPKPVRVGEDLTSADLASDPRYRLEIKREPSDDARERDDEVWLLVSQHVVSKDRPMDDTALHVFEEHTSGSRAISCQRAEDMNPYTNAQHLLVSSYLYCCNSSLRRQVRYPLRRSQTRLLLIPSRDRGLSRTDFSLQVLSSPQTALSFERIALSLPFSQSVAGALTSRNAGGHPGFPSFGSNPQYRVTVSAPSRGGKAEMRVAVRGDREVAWGVKLLWGRGELVFDASDDAMIADSGAYSYGLAYVDVPSLEQAKLHVHSYIAGTYTLVISAFEPGQTGQFVLDVESSAAVTISPIPAEGAGMFARSIEGVWDEETAGGRPSGGGYELNPRIEVILPQSGTLM
ncbi:cysteine protease [Saitozyma podzolica]|uniref:Cysteine protease n=1 Tax=Saitozyma podzolica TaxID=1890683 RepID=A0A427YTR5_9TREE|nr:cysteine protease [Saitozyma podzolica]